MVDTIYKMLFCLFVHMSVTLVVLIFLLNIITLASFVSIMSSTNFSNNIYRSSGCAAPPVITEHTIV